MRKGVAEITVLTDPLGYRMVLRERALSADRAAVLPRARGGWRLINTHERVTEVQERNMAA